MASIESVVSSATKIKPKSKEPRQEYLARLVEAAGDLPEEAWDKLPDDAQEWANEAVKQLNDKKDITDPSGKTNGGSEPASAKPAKKPSKKASGSKAAPKKSAKPASKSTQKAAGGKKAEAKGSSKAPAKTAPKKAVGDVSGGSMTFLKEMLIKDPNMAKDAIMEKMRAKGFQTSEKCVATWKAYFRHSIKVLQKNGYLKDFEL